MGKRKVMVVIKKFASLLMAFTILGNISTINAEQLDSNQNEVKELYEQEAETRISELDDVQVTFEGTTNPALQIDISEINKRKPDTYKYTDNLYGIVRNKSNKTYSFTVRANFYNSKGYMYRTSSYRLVNVRPNEEESFYAPFILLNINDITFSKKSPQYINKEIEIDTDFNNSSSKNEYKYYIYMMEVAG